MERSEVYLVVDGDEVRLGSVEEVLTIARIHRRKAITTDDWRIIFEAIGVLASAVEEIAYGSGNSESVQVTIELR